jgi:hydroxymethylbilane synthase
MQTRIEKVLSGDVDGAILAMAGLKRVGMDHFISQILCPKTEIIPSSGQGAIAVTVASDNIELKNYLKSITHPLTDICVRAERSFVESLHGTCHTPIGSWIYYDNGIYHFKGMIQMNNSPLLFIEEHGNDPFEITKKASFKLLDLVNQF